MKKHEKKYIDSEAFFKAINTLPYKDTSYPDASAYNGAISDVADMLTHFPAADVAEVVRCKDCEYLDYVDEHEKWCMGRGYPATMVKDDGYCSYGARKNG